MLPRLEMYEVKRGEVAGPNPHPLQQLPPKRLEETSTGNGGERDLGDDRSPVAHALLDFVGHLVPLRLPPVADLLYALLRPDLLLLSIAMQCVRSEIMSVSSLLYSLTFFGSCSSHGSLR